MTPGTSPYAYEDKDEREAQMGAYLSWELGLVAQLERDDHFIKPIPMGANGKEQP
jgi:hypothetical protein